ncbi:hypothetical protein [Moraxella lacunata]|jgi:hypothetical protein|uniref:hypothetical protein n=1 Tax=Moraxella lacunata TaxID=477 RepID=UPI003EE2F26F
MVRAVLLMMVLKTYILSCHYYDISSAWSKIFYFEIYSYFGIMNTPRDVATFLSQAWFNYFL